MLILIVALSVLRGRLYCNTVCPVGAFLGLLSKVSLFRISIDKTGCTKCGKCIAACKAECINIKDQTVDFSRCVGCENCIKVCETNDISYKLAFAGKKAEKPAKTDDSKRDFFQKTTIYLAGLLGISETIKAQNKKPGKTANGHQEIHQSNHLIPVVKENPVAPPGSLSIEHMKEKCTACHLCVSVCPMHVLKPSFLEYGFTGMLIPHMDYETHYCNYECTLCTEVCPTGSILKISTEEKKTIQMGIVKFIEDNCIVKTENTACGSCSEHCPTQAVTMVPYKDGLTIPTTKESICIGCGACEYACPVRPHRAIYVKSNPEHLTAKIPKTEKLKENLEEDFPF